MIGRPDMGGAYSSPGKLYLIHVKNSTFILFVETSCRADE